jgi:hypothetical protein
MFAWYSAHKGGTIRVTPANSIHEPIVHARDSETGKALCGAREDRTLDPVPPGRQRDPIDDRWMNCPKCEASIKPTPEEFESGVIEAILKIPIQKEPEAICPHCQQPSGKSRDMVSGNDLKGIESRCERCGETFAMAWSA